MTFIKLTTHNGKVTYINPAFVTSVQEGDDTYTRIWVSNSDFPFIVKQDLKEVLQRIEEMTR